MFTSACVYVRITSNLILEFFMRRDEAIKLLASNLSDLRSQYQVTDLSIFGSVARNQASPSSDIDLLVDFAKTPGLLKYIELKGHLEELLGVPVDLVTRKALKQQLRETILAEAVHVH
jgi:predicted nucleotidyltransferase